MTDYVILSAGKGSRLWPITESTPKTLVRILGKPILQWAVEGVLPDADKVVLVVSSDHEGLLIQEHFSKLPYHFKLRFVRQENQLGTADAVLSARKELGEQNPFVVLNGDTFADPTFYAQVARAASDGKAFLMAKRVQDASPYGLLKVESGQLKSIEEKPPQPVEGLINTGCYFVPPTFWKQLNTLKPSPRGELEATDALQMFAATHPVNVVGYGGYWNDVGYFWNYLDSSAYALENLMQSEILGEIDAGAHVRGNAFIGKGSVVKAGTVIEGPAYIGDGCVLGPSAIVRAYSYLEGENHIGTNTEIKNTVVMRGASLHGAYAGDSIICPNVNLGAGTRIANLKFDETPVKSEIKGAIVSSNRRKLGAVIGEGTKTGVNVSINCGVLIGSHCRIYPNTFVRKNLASGSTYSENAGSEPVSSE
jgi:bifunctional UDP-N-acetylglucosamine pyrophosphorylase/glucosamine-1-phosphate N-acetyltransferase